MLLGSEGRLIPFSATVFCSLTSANDAMATVLPSRLAALTRLRCTVFQTAYNPTSIRTGAKYLRARLRGPSMVNYYPEELTVSQLRRETGWRIDDQAELQRLQDVEDKKARGKGTPKKAKSKGACWSTLRLSVL